MRGVESNRIRPDHLSWQKFLQKIEQKFKIAFSPETCKLGWICPAPAIGLSDGCFSIGDEVSFHNAIGILRSTSSNAQRVAKVTLYLWSLKPQESIFHHSSHTTLPSSNREPAAASRVSSPPSSQEPVAAFRASPPPPNQEPVDAPHSTSPPSDQEPVDLLHASFPSIGNVSTTTHFGRSVGSAPTHQFEFSWRYWGRE